MLPFCRGSIRNLGVTGTYRKAFMVTDTEAGIGKTLGFIKKILTLLVVASIAFGVVGFIFGVIVPPGEMAIRQINFGPGHGLSRVGLEPGLHWKIPFYSEIYFVPEKIQLIDFHREQDSSPSSFPALEVQTSDRATVDVDATIMYQFFSSPGEENGLRHGGPEELLKTIGATDQLWVNKVRRTADDAIKRALGSLTTGQFYDPELREKQLKVAVDYMNLGNKDLGINGLATQGVRVDAVLIRRYTYREERIENAIFQKNLQDQEEALNVAESRLSEAQARSADEEAKGEARNRTLQIQGEESVKIVRSEGDLYEVKVRAEADLEVAKAKAEVDKLKAAALSKGLGAEIYVARELVPLVASLKGGVVTDVDPYDVGKWIKKLGINENKQGGER